MWKQSKSPLVQDAMHKALQILKKGGTILYPTDTVWGIGCDATHNEAVSKIYKLKNRNESKALLCLVSNFRMLGRYIEDIPEVAYEIIKQSNRPITIVYDKPKSIAQNLVASDNTLGVRVVEDPFCKALIQRLKRPLVATSANCSGQPTPKRREHIQSSILEGVDYVVNLPLPAKNANPSTIIKIGNDSTVQIIRK